MVLSKEKHKSLNPKHFHKVKSVKSKITKSSSAAGLSSAYCSWWWLCYMSKRIIWTSACVAKPASSASCSWWWLRYMSKRIIWTSACVAKPTSSASCSWWWLCQNNKIVPPLEHQHNIIISTNLSTKYN